MKTEETSGGRGRFEVTVNGETTAVAGDSRLSDLLETLGRRPEAVAVELNGEIVPRKEYPERRLAAGDRLEVVHFVQGGAGRSAVRFRSPRMIR